MPSLSRKVTNPMRPKQRLDLDLPPRYDSQLLAVAALRLLEDLADDLARTGDRDGLDYLAYRAARMTDNVCFAASEAGAAQRKRLAEARGFGSAA
jgi:hypothetical protein